MRIQIRGARTLTAFTESIAKGFLEVPGGDAGFELVQIHGSPQSAEEDQAILRQLQPNSPRKILIHRPDELLLNEKLKTYFSENPKERLVFLGDLTFRDQFWKDREAYSEVVPHPFTDLTLPSREKGRYVVGAFTSWGEMRKLEHFLSLIEELKNTTLLFKVGGTLNGVPLRPGDVGANVVLSHEPFVPHFNVQLYHLHGRKRYGESSGSLHRGVSIPVIFEANGAERLEQLAVVKIAADDELKVIDFKEGARRITSLVNEGIETSLARNFQSALQNSPIHFAQAILASHP